VKVIFFSNREKERERDRERGKESEEDNGKAGIGTEPSRAEAGKPAERQKTLLVYYLKEITLVR